MELRTDVDVTFCQGMSDSESASESDSESDNESVYFTDESADESTPDEIKVQPTAKKFSIFGTLMTANKFSIIDTLMGARSSDVAPPDALIRHGTSDSEGDDESDDKSDKESARPSDNVQPTATKLPMVATTTSTRPYDDKSPDLWSPMAFALEVVDSRRPPSF